MNHKIVFFCTRMPHHVSRSVSVYQVTTCMWDTDQSGVPYRVWVCIACDFVVIGCHKQSLWFHKQSLWQHKSSSSSLRRQKRDYKPGWNRSGLWIRDSVLNIAVISTVSRFWRVLPLENRWMNSLTRVLRRLGTHIVNFPTVSRQCQGRSFIWLTKFT